MDGGIKPVVDDCLFTAKDSSFPNKCGFLQVVEVVIPSDLYVDLLNFPENLIILYHSKRELFTRGEGQRTLRNLTVSVALLAECPVPFSSYFR